MAVTSEEQATLDQYKKGDGSRPNYYDSLEEKEKEISSDFESFSILLDNNLREEIISRLEDQTTDENTDRNTLYLEALDNEEADSDAMLTDFRVSVDDVSLFRSNVANSSFGNASEVSLMSQDIQRPVEAIVEGYEHHFHRRAIARLLRDLNTISVGNYHVEKQRDSWKTPLSEYRK